MCVSHVKCKATDFKHFPFVVCRVLKQQSGECCNFRVKLIVIKLLSYYYNFAPPMRSLPCNFHFSTHDVIPDSLWRHNTYNDVITLVMPWYILTGQQPSLQEPRHPLPKPALAAISKFRLQRTCSSFPPHLSSFLPPHLSHKLRHRIWLLPHVLLHKQPVTAAVQHWWL